MERNQGTRKTNRSRAPKGAVDPVFLTIFRTEPRKGDLKKIEIVETAISVIAKEGIEGCNFEAIAKRLKTRRSHIAYYFKSMDEILEAGIQFVLRKVYEYVIRSVSNTGKASERFESYVTANFDWARENPDHVTLIFLFYFYATLKPQYRGMQSEIRRTAIVRLTALVAEVVREKKIRLKRKEEEVGESIHSLLSGRLFYLITSTRFTQKKEVEAAKAEVLAGAYALIRA